ncbi:ABC-type transport auxiliary lipoprotein family protein [Roseicitreum antarcticum]|uniref:Cholesterol transport system auxiliary component n=1 Tax=Roseicitreum antarcticum TaxID=564137 RepID=A0A1H2QJ53_9RHOB|nr:ABC-type transport auxiliary lipoprotein family protein [Roseicitreum antarcticum]SDW06950.1 cholesterol transport system auxiliary component [Roseicitreum antarcticum]
MPLCPSAVIRPAILSLSLALLSGCGAVSALSEATTELDAYTLSAPAPDSPPAPGRGHLVVEAPSAPGALATDRILIKPLRYQAQYLENGRWSEPAPAQVQTLLVSAFQNMGGFRLVGRTGAGLMPDYTLMTDLQSFQAEPSGSDAAPITVKISAIMTLIREDDRRIAATRRFDATATVASDDTRAVVAGFDAAMRDMLPQIVRWTQSQTR